jgi:hypothetical protein
LEEGGGGQYRLPRKLTLGSQFEAPHIEKPNRLEEEMKMTHALEALLSAAKSANPSAEHREEQRRSFAFGNTAFENSRITREMIDQQAERLNNKTHG